MLKQRVITATVLLAVLLPSLIVRSAWPFAMLSLLMIGAAGWEWGRLNAVPRLAVAMGSGSQITKGNVTGPTPVRAPPPPCRTRAFQPVSAQP